MEQFCCAIRVSVDVLYAIHECALGISPVTSFSGGKKMEQIKVKAHLLHVAIIEQLLEERAALVLAIDEHQRCLDNTCCGALPLPCYIVLLRGRLLSALPAAQG